MNYSETGPFLQNFTNHIFLTFFSTFSILPLLDSVIYWFYSLFLSKKLNVKISLELKCILLTFVITMNLPRFTSFSARSMDVFILFFNFN